MFHPDRNYRDVTILTVILTLAHAAMLLDARVCLAQDAKADVVVIVDTSISMREPGMDPQRASLLVTKLLADIVPGELAVVRLLDIANDADLLPREETGITEPCREDPSRQCNVVKPASDWRLDAREKQLGTKVRPSRGDPAFKKQLESHLEQRIGNSMFDLAFAAAEGIFAEHRAVPGREAVPRTVIWLSDGKATEPDVVRLQIKALVNVGVGVKAIVFGNGDTTLAEQAGLEALQVSTPAEMMKAFADAFRQIVQAPYRIDHRLAEAPEFEMKRHVDEAWIVVYGDDSLGDVSLESPGGEVRTDHASDKWSGAGAYRVAYVKSPDAGTWKVRARSGGPGVAYAVVQRSALTPSLLEPATAISGAETLLVGAVRAGLEGEVITDPEVLAGLSLDAEVQGRSMSLTYSGADGRFTTPATFSGSGRIPVRLHLSGELVSRRGEASVEVSGEFSYTGGPVHVDLGRLGVDTEHCRELTFSALHIGEVGFELERVRSLPSGHDLEMRLDDARLRPGGGSHGISPGDRMEVCLKTTDQAPSSTADGELWLELRVAGSALDSHRVPIHLHWQVEGLTFWQRWGRLILTILGILLLLVIIAGYVVPHRFSGSLAVAFVPDREELDEQSPQPVLQWRGVGIGFYRHARAFLHPDYRLSGKAQGALASLHAQRASVDVKPGRSQSLHRESLDGDWENVAPQGRRVRAGDVYRIGDKGPYFRISTRGR